MSFKGSSESSQSSEWPNGTLMACHRSTVCCAYRPLLCRSSKICLGYIPLKLDLLATK